MLIKDKIIFFNELLNEYNLTHTVLKSTYEDKLSIYADKLRTINPLIFKNFNELVSPSKEYGTLLGYYIEAGNINIFFIDYNNIEIYVKTLSRKKDLSYFKKYERLMKMDIIIDA